MSTQIKLGLGSALSTFGVLTTVLSLLTDWAVLRPWGFLSGMVVGVVTGPGATLVITGLVERRSNN